MGKYDSNEFRLEMTRYRTLTIVYPSCMAHLRQIAQQGTLRRCEMSLIHPTQGSRSGQITINCIMVNTHISSLELRDKLRGKPN